MRNVDRYVKVLSLVCLILVVYWRDLAELSLIAFSTRWVSFTFAIIPLAFLFLFQRRKALDTFAAFPEGRHAQDVVLIIIAICLYMFGSYSEYRLWFHVSSLIVFIMAYLMLRIGFRFSKTVLPPTIALAVMSLWSIPSNGVTGTSTATIIVYSISGVYPVFLTIPIFRYYSGGAEAWQSCSICKSDKGKNGPFCLQCGRQLAPLERSSNKHVLTKFSMLLAIVIFLAFFSVPVLVLADDGANVTFFAGHGPEFQPIIITPQGWVLESSTRLSAYESENFEDFAVLNKYAEREYAENKSYILLEISGGDQWPYRMNSWQIEGWERLRGAEIVLADNIVMQYISLRRHSNTIIVLYNPQPLTLLFKTSVAFENKNVGLSVFMNVTSHDELQNPQVLIQLREMGEPIVRRWINFELWTLHSSTLTRSYAEFADAFYTVVAVVCVFSFAGWARYRDTREARLIHRALSLPKDEALLFLVGREEKRGQTGAELYEAYKRLVKTDKDQFYKKLTRLVSAGLIKKHYKLKNRQVSLTWKPAI